MKNKLYQIALGLLVVCSLLPMSQLNADAVEQDNVYTTITADEQRDYDQYVANDVNYGEYVDTTVPYDDTETRALSVVENWEVVETPEYYQLKNYVGSDTDLVIPGSLNGKQTAVANADLQKLPQNVTSVTFSEVNGTKVKLLDRINKILGKAYASLTTIDLRGLDVSAATTLTGVGFDNTSLRTINVTGMDLTSIRSVNQMFAYTDCLEEIIGLSTWDVSNIQDFSGFMEAKRKESSVNFNFGDVSNWNMANATSIERFFASRHFADPQAPKQLENWNISANCVDVTGIFSMGEFTDINLSKWNTSNVVETTSLFWGCKQLTNVNVANWNVEKVVKTNSMFRDCQSLQSIDLSNWYTPNLEEPAYMFSNCKSLRLLDMSRFSMQNVEIWTADGKVNKKRTEMFRRDAQLLPILIVTTDPKLVSEYPYKDDWATPSGFKADANGGTFSDGTTLKEQTFYTIDHKDVNRLNQEKQQFIANVEQPTKDGYQFSSWAEEPATKTLDYSLFEAANATYKAQWSANSYQVAFDGNGATTGTMPNQTFSVDTPQTLSTNQFARDGYTFAGWSTTPTGAVEYTDAQEVINLTTQQNGVVTLYAVWTEGGYTLSFDGNGAESGTLDPVALTYTQTYQIPANPFARTGYKFVGWNTAADGSGQMFADQASVSQLSPVVGGSAILYAQWAPISYSVQFDPNGGEGQITTQTLVYDQSANLDLYSFTAPTDKGFIGWSSTPDGVVEYLDGAQVLNLTTVDGDIISLYAVYQDKPQPPVVETPQPESTPEPVKEEVKQVSTGTTNAVIGLLVVIGVASGIVLFIRRK